MKNFTLLAAGLALLTVGASANEAQPVAKAAPSGRVMRLTTAGIVTTVALPADVLNANKRSTFRAHSTVMSEDKLVLKGDVRFEDGNGVTLSADQMTVKRVNGQFSPFILGGKVNIQIQKDGKQVMQISADNAVIEPA